jgi:ribose 5-phosphate isomerase B
MIAIGADHGGYKLKEEIKKFLDEKEIKYKDFGTYSEDRVDYPNIAKEVSKAVQNKECEKGILICRSGYGMAMVANKFKGIRSAPCFCEEAAKFSRMHNDTNVLALGADYVTTSEAIKILRIWLATEFEGGRHSDRLALVAEIENENMK